jgi:hypothetical protein
MKNPFKEGSTQHHDFNVLSDLKWHCTKCELKTGQAKTWQVWRQEQGIQMDTDENGKWDGRFFCKKCGRVTVHRKLKSVELLDETKSRSGISPSLAKKVKEIYNDEEAVFLRKISPNQLEVDHKFPQVRWGKNEDKNGVSMTENEIKSKFILLSRSNNLLKSRHCEKCFKTGERGSFPGIYFWYNGTKEWDKKIDKHNEDGCVGCFWHDPYKWRKKLNDAIK